MTIAKIATQTLTILLLRNNAFSHASLGVLWFVNTCLINRQKLGKISFVLLKNVTYGLVLSSVSRCLDTPVKHSHSFLI